MSQFKFVFPEEIKTLVGRKRYAVNSNDATLQRGVVRGVTYRDAGCVQVKFYSETHGCNATLDADHMEFYDDYKAACHRMVELHTKAAEWYGKEAKRAKGGGNK